jgi:hypothetical protein
MLDKYFLLNGDEYTRIKPIAASCVSTPKKSPRLPGQLRQPQNHGETFAHPDAFAPLFRISYMSQAAGEKNNANHEPQQKRPEIGKAGELSQHALSRGGCVFYLLISYSGIFPCFFGGFLSRFVSSISSAWISFLRVSCGRITESTYPRSAAT